MYQKYNINHSEYEKTNSNPTSFANQNSAQLRNLYYAPNHLASGMGYNYSLVRLSDSVEDPGENSLSINRGRTNTVNLGARNKDFRDVRGKNEQENLFYSD